VVAEQCSENIEGIESGEGLGVQMRVSFAIDKDCNSMTAWIPSWLPFSYIYYAAIEVCHPTAALSIRLILAMS
jgi:hypothetical protein